MVITTLLFSEKLERAKRFELSTPTLARLCSTPELRPLALFRPAAKSPDHEVRRAVSTRRMGLQV